MSNLAYLPTPRTLAHVLLEIGAAEREVAMWDARAIADPDGFEARGEDYQLSDADDRLTELRSEGRKLVEAATGCSFNDLLDRLQ